MVLVSALIFFSSCEKEEIESTETVAMAGEWYVTGDAIDTEGNVVYEDVWGLGKFHLETYNTSANTTTEMWIDDNGNFWDFKNRISIDLDAMTFQATEAQNEAYDCLVTISDGKIMYDAATTPSGMPADSIVFNVWFDDDPYPELYDFAQYRITGFRYTGFTLDD
jgi:hypothetical protein